MSYTKTISHTKSLIGSGNIAKFESVVGGVFNTDNIWSCIDYLFEVKLYHENDDGSLIPIYYIPESSLTGITIDCLNPDEYEIEQNPDLGLVDECGDPLHNECLLVKLKVNLASGRTESITDECGDVTEIPNHYQVECPFTLHFDNGVLTSQPYTFHAFEDPLPIKIDGVDESMLDYVKQFDVYDSHGNGRLYSTPTSKTSEFLQIIFGDDFTKSINEKIINFKENNIDIDLSDIPIMDDIGSMLGIGGSTFVNNMPKELLDVVKISSISYERLFGHIDYSKIYREENVGVQISEFEIVHENDLIFVKKIIDDGTLEHFRAKTHSPVSLHNLIDGYDRYSLEKHTFWHPKVNPEDLTFSKENNVGGFLDLDYLYRIPTKEEWNEIIKQRIEYYLLYNMIHHIDCELKDDEIRPM